MEQVLLKKILTNAIYSQQISCTLADTIATAAGFDLTEMVDPIQTADHLLLIGRQLYQIGSIDHVSANAFEQVANSIHSNLHAFEVA